MASIVLGYHRKSRETISFTAFLQLFCKNGGPVAQPFPPCFPYQPPAPFASAVQETKNDHCFLFSAPRERPKRSGNEWFTSKHIVQDGSHSLCAVFPVSTLKAPQRHIARFRKFLRCKNVCKVWLLGTKIGLAKKHSLRGLLYIQIRKGHSFKLRQP